MNPFNRVQALRPGRSVFDLSYAKKFSGRMGYLYPVLHEEMVPGDVFDLGCEAVVRFAPMVAPVLHEIVLKADYFFVPYRILGARDVTNTDGKTAWERFITGGQSGADVARSTLGVLDLSGGGCQEGGLWDHLGIPPGVSPAVAAGDDSPLAFPGRAYWLIYNEYYRDPNLEAEKDIVASASRSSILAWCNWDADYFTRALPFQQRGTAPALPVSGIAHAVWPAVDAAVPNNLNAAQGSKAPSDTHTKAALENNVVDLSSATSVNISELRVAVQLQRWMERSARSGYRYVEYLYSHFGVSPRDDRLDRPEYIGGVRQPIVISEVLQTSKSEAGAPQGNLAGHGIMAGGHRVGRYHAKEFGVIMCLVSISPKPAYSQGISRQWLRRSRYDFYHPEFANLSEQAVEKEEIYFGTVQATNLGIFGYQGRFDEMRSKRDLIAGAMRSSLNYWHLGRQFGSLPALNSDFGHVDPSTVTRIFAVPSADHLYVHWGNRVRAIRPLPPQSNPGLMDHEYGGL